MVGELICVTIRGLVNQDSVIESSESFNITLQRSDPPGIVDSGFNQLLVTVEDSNGKTNLDVHQIVFFY